MVALAGQGSLAAEAALVATQVLLPLCSAVRYFCWRHCSGPGPKAQKSTVSHYFATGCQWAWCTTPQTGHPPCSQKDEEGLSPGDTCHIDWLLHIITFIVIIRTSPTDTMYLHTINLNAGRVSNSGYQAVLSPSTGPADEMHIHCSSGLFWYGNRK